MINREIKAQFSTRVILLGGVLAIVVMLILMRVIELNIVDKEFLQRQGNARHLRVVVEPAHRGMITDRNGEPLAISTPVDTAWANPYEVLKSGVSLDGLAKILGADSKTLRQQLSSRRHKEFIYLKRHVTPDIVQKITSLGIPGVGFLREYRRYYPAGAVTAQVLGFTNIDDVGQEGIELAFNKKLSGISGSKRVIKDRLGQIVENVERVVTPQAGEDIILSLDRRIQYLAYKEIKSAVIKHQASSGSVVVVDAMTGEIFAMTNYPSFNPNNREELDKSHLRNRAITDIFEPGSTIKPFTVVAGLQAGKYNKDSVIDTSPGRFVVSGKVVRDHRDYGVISLEKIIAKSSNVGASKIALSIKPQWMWDTLNAVGFGELSGSLFPGEARGNLRNYTDWNKVERASLSYGYGTSISVLQLARAYTIFANDFTLKTMTLMRQSYVPDRSVETNLKALYLKQVRTMMESVVAPEGTGNRAAIKGYRVAGKTGTIKKLGKDGKYLDNHYVALFAGMAPASNPRLVMVVIVDDPQGKEFYGGRVAAPVFSKVMTGALRLLDIQPDALSLSPRDKVALYGEGLNDIHIAKSGVLK
ncbi:MAG: peptidoglycan D,D-transpeptidase FtsI family protein [Thiohalomonadales bacterium]